MSPVPGIRNRGFLGVRRKRRLGPEDSDFNLGFAWGHSSIAFATLADARSLAGPSPGGHQVLDTAGRALERNGWRLLPDRQASGLSLFRGQVLVMPNLQVDWWIPSSAIRRGWPFAHSGSLTGSTSHASILALSVRSRHLIRVILAVVVGNALVLSIFGIVQKLAGSKGIYFGLSASHRRIISSASVCIRQPLGGVHGPHDGCLPGPRSKVRAWRNGRGVSSRAIAHGTGFNTFLLAASIPLSGSRACSILIGIMLVVALIKEPAPHLQCSAKLGRFTIQTSSCGMTVLATALAIAGLWTIAGDVIRVPGHQDQGASHRRYGPAAASAPVELSTTTPCQMANDRLLFGWGMGKLPHTVFPLTTTRRSQTPTAFRQIYHDAHSDWLQSIAELGLHRHRAYRRRHRYLPRWPCAASQSFAHSLLPRSADASSWSHIPGSNFPSEMSRSFFPGGSAFLPPSNTFG